MRCDSGVTEGSDISIYYDPMICKLVCYGDTREEAIDKSIKALDAYVIEGKVYNIGGMIRLITLISILGVTHNIPLLRDILTEENFVKGNLTTNYLMDNYPDGFKGKKVTAAEKKELLAFISSVYVQNELGSYNIVNDPNPFTTKEPVKTFDLVVTIDEEDIECHVDIHPEHFEVCSKFYN